LWFGKLRNEFIVFNSYLSNVMILEYSLPFGFSQRFVENTKQLGFSPM